MADTVASGVLEPGTDYRYQAMTDSFVGIQTAANQSFASQMARAQDNAAVQLQGMGMIHSQWLGSFAQQQPAITANAIGQLNAAAADGILNFIKIGAALSNSASPPIPGYQNLGPVYPGGHDPATASPKV